MEKQKLWPKIMSLCLTQKTWSPKRSNWLLSRTIFLDFYPRRISFWRIKKETAQSFLYMWQINNGSGSQVPVNVWIKENPGKNLLRIMINLNKAGTEVRIGLGLDLKHLLTLPSIRLWTSAVAHSVSIDGFRVEWYETFNTSHTPAFFFPQKGKKDLKTMWSLWTDSS